MAVIDDGTKAVSSACVATAIKWEDDASAWLTLTLTSGEAVVLRFTKVSERDDFYKQLVAAMDGA